MKTEVMAISRDNKKITLLKKYKQRKVIKYIFFDTRDGRYGKCKTKINIGIVTK